VQSTVPPSINIGGALVGTLRFAHPTALVQTPPNPLRAKTNFASRFNVIWVVQIVLQK
jgi:hypothetical protein